MWWVRVRVRLRVRLRVQLGRNPRVVKGDVKFGFHLRCCNLLLLDGRLAELGADWVIAGCRTVETFVQEHPNITPSC